MKKLFILLVTFTLGFMITFSAKRAYAKYDCTQVDQFAKNKYEAGEKLHKDYYDADYKSKNRCTSYCNMRIIRNYMSNQYHYPGSGCSMKTYQLWTRANSLATTDVKSWCTCVSEKKK